MSSLSVATSSLLNFESLFLSKTDVKYKQFHRDPADIKLENAGNSLCGQVAFDISQNRLIHMGVYIGEDLVEGFFINDLRNF